MISNVSGSPKSPRCKSNIFFYDLSCSQRDCLYSIKSQNSFTLATYTPDLPVGLTVTCRNKVQIVHHMTNKPNVGRTFQNTTKNNMQENALL